MKIFKQKQQSIIPRPFALQGRDRMAIGVLVFFDLNDPDHPLSEQDLWKAVPGELGKQGSLDQGLPKPRGEVLVFGSGFAPRGTTRTASRVSIEVGPIKKSLDVFGDRFWEAGRITDPLPFKEMPLTWDRAFGGPDFAPNPLGKGVKPVPGPGGHEFHPLPNLELPGRTIGSPTDRPEPAGLGPLDLMWPQRFKKNGTYDKRWKRERWPWFPDDMNWEFFNLAAEDQYAQGFFQGGERCVVTGMHPDLPVIETTLPRIRMRVFVTLNGEYRPHCFPTGPLPSNQLRPTDEFREVSTRLETVWFFPTIQRGLVLFRGVTDIKDDEMADVLRILVRPEPLDSTPQTIEFYRELQIRELDRGVNIDPAPLQRAQEMIKDAKRRIGNIPKQIDDIRKSSMGQKPTMPLPDPAEEAVKYHRMLDKSLALVDRMEAEKLAIEQKVGVKAPIDKAIFTHFRQKIAELKTTLDSTTTKLAAAKDEIIAAHDQGLKQATDHFKTLSPEIQAKSGLDLNQPFKPIYPFTSGFGPWHETGHAFVVRCRKDLELDEGTQAELERLGIQSQTQRRHWLGIAAQARSWPGPEFGLAAGQTVDLPVGLVLPRFEGPRLNRILVRPKGPDGTYSLPLREKLAEGSDASALFIESASLIDLPGLPAAAGAPVVVVATELEALYAEQEAGDFCSVLAAESAAVKRCEDADKALKAAPLILVALPEKYAGSASLTKGLLAWQAAFPQAAPLEMVTGATLFESRTQEPVRDWIVRHLPKEMAAVHDTGITLPEPGKHLSPDFMKGFKLEFPNLKAIIPGVIAQLRAFHLAKFDDVTAKRDEVMAQAREQLIKYGQDPAILDRKPSEGPVDFAGKGKDMAEQIRQQMAKLKQAGHLSAADETKMTDAADWAERFSAESQVKWDTGMKLLAEKKAELEDGIAKVRNHEVPAAMKAKFAEAGIDLDKIRPLTREQVIALRDQGQSPDGADLTGIDLSELDLHGLNFTGCKLTRTALRKANLDGAIFTKVMGAGADFSEASMVGAVLDNAMFQGAKFTKAKLQGASFNMTMANKADFSQADLRNTKVHMAMFKEIKMNGADLRGASLELTMLGGEASQTDFNGVRMKQVLAAKMNLDGARFTNATLFRTLFQETKGQGVQFSDADLRQFRIAKDSELPGADFSRADLRGAGLRQSNLTGANFTRSRLDTAVIDNCFMPQAKLYKASAKGTRLRNTNLEGADLRFINLFTGSVGKTRLVKADLRGAHLYCADMFKVVMGETRLEGTVLTGTLLEGREGLIDGKA
ncbi:DUF2169 domain-containing protein [uncultured Thiodictyon sp.]|uniref:DUF2169 family type VI secretion system accessory protein n=1 Tax=uncultured Thiodictyon sp. TaxID=1846217 RepID=UPI0025D2736F|nr:DUF2169 domain-containing protein [uncultured Thiodictyon sp.]